ncbi:hypothetical protein Srufu_009570 [Streptomyces libani subsp. rufus]|nr:hypothetical protein Srufu_009570 [Streptomyces libani subsp. rufus]
MDPGSAAPAPAAPAAGAERTVQRTALRSAPLRAVEGTDQQAAQQADRQTARLRVAEPERVGLLAADTPAQLADSLRDMEEGDGASAGLDAPVPDDGPCRLALLDPTPQRRALAAKILVRGLPWRGRGEVWFTPTPFFGPYARQEGRGSPSSSRGWRRSRRPVWTTPPTCWPCPGPRSPAAPVWSNAPWTPSPSAACSPARWTNWASPQTC